MSDASGSSFSTIDRIFYDINSSSSGSKRAEITSLMTIMIVKDNLPLHTVNGEGFRSLMKSVAPHFPVPDRKTIRRKIDRIYAQMVELKKREMKNVKHLALTFDLWKDSYNNTSYLGVTGHHIKDWNLNSLLLSCSIQTERHTSVNICKSLDEILSFWEIDKSKITACVTDNGANVKKAVTDWIGSSKHLPCFAHTLNLVVKDAIEDSGNFKEILTKVRTIIQYFKQSGPAADELRKVQPSNRILKVKQDVETRWNSSYLMLNRYIELKDYINLALSHLVDAPTQITGAENEVISDGLRILKPFFSITEEMSAEKVVTLSKVIPIQYYLRQGLSEMKLATQIGSLLQQSLIQGLEVRFINVQKNMIATIATILDPRFKKMNIELPESLSRALAKLNGILPSTTPPPTQEQSDEEETEDDVWAIHDRLANQQKRNEPVPADILSSKLKTYLSTPLENRKADPLKIWSQIQCTYWEVSQIVPIYLCVPATSVPSERLFSKAGATMNQRRCSMSPETLNKILFLNSLQLDELKTCVN